MYIFPLTKQYTSAFLSFTGEQVCLSVLESGQWFSFLAPEQGLIKEKGKII